MASQPRPDEQLENTLRRISEAAQRVCDGVELTDPDAIAALLARECRALPQSLADLMADPHKPAEPTPP